MELTEEAKQINADLGRHGTFRNLLLVQLGEEVESQEWNIVFRVLYYLICGSNKDLINKADIKVESLVPHLLEFIE